ncbi:hypothetical protein V1517DRAFT_327218 [Lipomyces orientalis]|uniref:Uncharacterized protein n=1 Tax=Lipomyces orientalis TaxID=1233043 RepID=A0ACC3TJ83_9ASCO
MNSLDRFGLAADIIGVLTFVVATVAAVAGFYALTVEADAEIDKFNRDLELAETQLKPQFLWKTAIPEGMEDYRHSAELNRTLQSTEESIRATVASLEEDFAGLGPKLLPGNWKHSRLERRIRWASKRQEVLGKFQHLSSQRLVMVALHVHLVLWYCHDQRREASRQTALLERMNETLLRLMNRPGN